MSVAKGRLFVSAEQLQTLLQLPEGVEILALKPKATEDGFEFLLVSNEESVLTHKGLSIGKLPRVDLELDIQYTGGLVENIPFPEVGRKEAVLTKTQAQLLFDAVGNLEVKDLRGEKTVEDSFRDVLKTKGIF